MRSHELAQKLLSLPDLEVMDEYAERTISNVSILSYPTNILVEGQLQRVEYVAYELEDIDLDDDEDGDGDENED